MTFLEWQFLANNALAQADRHFYFAQYVPDGSWKKDLETRGWEHLFHWVWLKDIEPEEDRC